LIAAIALVEGAVYPVTAQVAEESRLFSWTQAAILQAIDRHSKLALNALRLVTGRVREFQGRYRELATERVERRLPRMIIRLANQAGKKTSEGVLLDLPLTRQDLAEMSGTTLFTVSRILSQWEAQGLVQAGREKLLIVFPYGLVRIAEDLH
jgi:CRP-like cAMP-binding protein